MLLGLLLPLGVLGQGVLGGLTVIYDLKPGFVMSHYGLSMLILIAAWALWWRSRPEWEERHMSARPLPAPDRATLWTARLLVPIGALTVFAGTAATASGPHAGGAGTGDVIARLDVKGTGTLDWAIHQHGYIAATLGAAGADRAGHRAAAPRAARPRARAGDGARAAGGPGRGRRGAIRARAAGRARLGSRLPGDLHVGRAAVDVERRGRART